MTTSDLFSLIRSTLCKRLTADQAQQLVDATVPKMVSGGSTVFREGDKVDGLLLLVRGTVEIVRKRADGGEDRLATVEAPTVLGEMSLITDRGHSATIRAKTDCEFHVLTKAQFQRLLAADSLAAYKLILTIAEVLARRLYVMDDKVLELLARPTNGQPVEELADFKRKLFAEWSF